MSTADDLTPQQAKILAEWERLYPKPEGVAYPDGQMGVAERLWVEKRNVAISMLRLCIADESGWKPHRGGRALIELLVLDTGPQYSQVGDGGAQTMVVDTQDLRAPLKEEK